MTERSRRSAAALLAGVLTWSSACSFNERFDDEVFTETDVEIRIVDELGEPLADAEVRFGDTSVTSDDAGLAIVSIASPVVVTVSTDGTVPEPVAVAPRDGDVVVRLWDRTDANGRERTSLHFGGDVMLGRRYLDPDLSTPFVDDADSARRVVADLAPITAVADWTSVNVETVIGELPDRDALPAKRFLLQSTPLITEALDEMGVDLATLGNNHAYDWGEAGIETTLAALDDAGIAHVGAGASAEDAVRGHVSQVGDLAVGVISVTTVTGDFVNDQLPPASAAAPSDLAPDEEWQYERRPFAFYSPDGRLAIDERSMRIREVWDIVDDVESDEEFDDVGYIDDLWVAATTSFPELQDWVARRGHGGAAPYQRDDVDSEIARLRSVGADFVVVQVHGGYQFAEVNSRFLRTVARRSIDSGADAVIAHHPHVLQGVEWYDDKLIVYSLGNLVFDQGFLSTFPGAVLRVITDGTDVLEARLLPVILDRYRPVPVVGGAAQEIVRLIDVRTAQPATSGRVDDLVVGSVLDAPAHDRASTSFARGEFDRGEFDRSAAVVFERNSGLIERERSTTRRTVETADPFGALLPACSNVRTDVLDRNTFVGTDLFDWGDFDRSTAELRPKRFPVNWLVSRESERWAYDVGASGSDFDRAFTMFSDTDDTTTVRIGARVDVDAHRLFDDDGGPLDAPASYEVTLDARRVRGKTPQVRIITFEFDDTDPTVDPDSKRLHEVELPVQVPDDGEWHRISIPIPDAVFAPDAVGSAPNAATMLIDAPPALRGELTIDNVMFIEWRGATRSPTATWVEGDIVRSLADSVELEISGC